MKAKFTQSNPDIVLCEFMGYAFLTAADELGLPAIITAAMDLESMRVLTSYMLPSEARMCNMSCCCGCVCICPGIIRFITENYLAWKAPGWDEMLR